MKLDRGSLVLLDLDPVVGHEQRGTRPCVVVSDPDVVTDQRFPLLGVVPVTGTPGEGALYPSLAPGKSGLTKVSYALTDHVRSVDKRRVKQVFGRLTPLEIEAVDEGLALFLGLGEGLEPSA
jgi:mRNA interferase MazF